MVLDLEGTWWGRGGEVMETTKSDGRITGMEEGEGREK
jgi:hypothetical protein